MHPVLFVHFSGFGAGCSLLKLLAVEKFGTSSTSWLQMPKNLPKTHQECLFSQTVTLLSIMSIIPTLNCHSCDCQRKRHRAKTGIASLTRLCLFKLHAHADTLIAHLCFRFLKGTRFKNLSAGAAPPHPPSRLRRNV